MNLRLTLTAAVAVILASVSVYPLIQTAGWFWGGVGAVITVAIAGSLTRLSTLYAAIAGSVLALVAVCPLLFAPAWGLKIVGVAIIGITAAGRPRLRLLQALAIVISYLSALLIYLNVTFAAHLSVAAFVPTRASVSYLTTLVSQGMSERIYEPPVPSGPGVILLAAGGIGLMAAATDLIAVRLRSPAIAGLPLLALYCVRITTSAKQGGVGATVVFCLTLIGYLALLAADGRERLRIWGRLVTVWHGASGDPAEAADANRQVKPVAMIDGVEAPDTRALAASGRRIGLAAACIALIFPLLVPGISVHDLFHAEATGAGPGGPLIAPPNPLVQMHDQLLDASPQTVLTYQTTARNPRQQYLQVYVLNFNPTGGNWTLVPPGGPSTSLTSSHLASVPGVTAGTPQTATTTHITLSHGTTGYDSKLGFLPLPYAPMQVQAPGSWQEDNTTLMVYAAQPQLSGLIYSVTSKEAIPDSADERETGRYPAGISADYLGFPKGPRDELSRLATQITAHDRTPYEKALALQRYFQSGNFTYSVDVDLPNGITGLTDFLFETKTGFCQQFAFAMAGLARLVGIPSRIAVGYTAGNPTGHGVWKVTSADAHAWPELYFTGLGWIRFEPTPGGAQGTATVPQYGVPPGYGTVPTSPVTSKIPGSKTGSRGTNPNLAHIHNLTGGEPTGGSRIAKDQGVSPWFPLIVAAVVLVALTLPASARSVLRRRRLQTSGDTRLAHAVWRELRDDLADYGLSARVSESPRATAARVTRVAGLDPRAGEALTRIARAEERARYATAPLASPTLRSDSAAVRRALSQQATWAERWRARILPASMLAPIRTGLQHTLDIFGWMEAAGARFRGRGFGSGTISSGVRHQE
jgi:TgpA N-terminal domain/Transglutaminase-like superfamily